MTAVKFLRRGLFFGYLSCMTVIVAMAGPLSVIKQPEWGAILFEHFSDDNFSAIVRLLAREKQGLLTTHRVDAELLAAGMLLDLGLPMWAQQRVTRLAGSALSPQQNARLALAVARQYYHNQQYLPAEHWLKQVRDEYLLPRELGRKRLMTAQILFHRQHFAQAAISLAVSSDTSNLRWYALYNRGISLLKVNTEAARMQGRLLLSRVAELLPTEQEQYALKDRALLSLALDSVAHREPAAAEAALLRLRRKGPVSSDGLLVLGWAFAQQGQFKKALVYWSELADRRDELDPAVQESWLAVPYAYQRLQDWQGAASGYQRVLQRYQAALKRLQQLKRNHAWKALLHTSTATAVYNSEHNPTGLSLGLQRRLLGDARFYRLLQQWRQLERWQQRLDDSLQPLPALRWVLTANEQRFKAKAVIVRENLQRLQHLDVPGQLNHLQQQLQRARTQTLPYALLPADELKRVQRLDSAAALVDELPAERGKLRHERLRRLRGIELWRISRKRAGYEWQGQRAIAGLRRAVTRLQHQQRVLVQLLRRPRQPLAHAVRRVEQLAQRGRALSEALTELRQAIEDDMAARFEVQIGGIRKALSALADQSTLALARLRYRAAKDDVETSGSDDAN